MSWLGTLALLALLALLLLLSGVFSGSETGFYAASRLRMWAEADRGGRMARLIRFLFRDPLLLLITLLVGNNLMLELLTHLTEDAVSGREEVPPWARELLVTLLLTPVVFFFGELLPKDLYRRRPNVLLGWSAPFLTFARFVFLPLTLPLMLLSRGLETLMRVREKELSQALGRERVVDVLAEGRRAGALPERAQELALGVLDLRSRRVQDVLVPWSEVESVDLDGPEEEARARVLSSRFSRLPALRTEPGSDGGPGVRRVVGYVHQLDLLEECAAGASGARGTARNGNGGGDPPLPLGARVRDLLTVPANLPVDRALARLRLGGRRVALVGTPEEPQGLVTLKDLVQTISGDLAGW